MVILGRLQYLKISGKTTELVLHNAE